VGMTLQQKIAADLKAKGQAMPPAAGVVPVQKSAAPATTTTAAKPVATAPVATATPAKQTLAESSAAKKPSLAEVAKSMAENKPLALAKGINPPHSGSAATQVDIEESIAEKAVASMPPVVAAEIQRLSKPQKEACIEGRRSRKQNQAGIGFFLLVDALVEKGVPLKRVERTSSAPCAR